MCSSRNTRNGFSLLELLVVLAVVAVTVSILVPVFSAAREGFNRAQCAANLRQIGIAVHRYAQENENQLPESGGAGFWPWDLSVSLSQTLLETGAVEQDTFYCPSNQEFPQDDLWNFAVPSDGESGFRLIAYVLLLPGTAGVPEQHVNSHLGEQVVLNPRDSDSEPEFIIVPERQRELAVDGVISDSESRDSDFMGIQGGLPEPHRTNHMSGERPLGGNVLYLGGSVRWREFSEMEARSFGSPNFWW